MLTLTFISPVMSMKVENISYIKLATVTGGLIGLNTHHAPIIATLGTTLIEYDEKGSKRKSIAVELANLVFEKDVAKILCEAFYVGRIEDLEVLKQRKLEIEQSLQTDLQNLHLNQELDFVVHKLKALI